MTSVTPISPIASTPVAERTAPQPATAAAPGAFTQVLGQIDRSRPTVAMERTDPLQQFEGFIMRSFVETMLPKDNSFFGGGMAGDMWRSMMAEHMGDEIAAAGGVGIADLLREAEPTGAEAATRTLTQESQAGVANAPSDALKF